MFLGRILNWLRRGRNSSASEAEVHSHCHESSEHETEGGGVDYGVLANLSDAKCAAQNIDPPRPGRKTYTSRYDETSAMSTSDIKASIAQRITEGKGNMCGVLYRVLSERGEK